MCPSTPPSMCPCRYWFLHRVYHATPALAIKDHIDDNDEGSDKGGMLAAGGIEGGAGGAGGAVTVVVGPDSPTSCRGCSCAQAVVQIPQAVVQSVWAAARKTVRGWSVYWRQTSLLPGLALALLYINVRLSGDLPLTRKPINLCLPGGLPLDLP